MQIFSMIRLRALVITLMLAVTGPAAFAVTPDEILDDPVLEARAREISSGLRCLVYQNQSIDDSDAPLARVTDANGTAVVETGSHRGHATGTFFHLIGEAP